MAAETIVEVYRLNEDTVNKVFSAAVTLTYFGDTVHIHGLNGKLSFRSVMEVYQYLFNKGIKRVMYYRRGVLKERSLKERGIDD